MSSLNAFVGVMAPPIVDPASGQRYQIPGGSFELPIRYERCRNITVALPASLRVLRELLPEGVRARRSFGDSGILVIQFVDLVETSIGPYRECAISIGCHDDWSWPRLDVEVVWRARPAFALWLSVTSEFARLSGQAVWGYPKQIAETDLSWRDGTFSGRVCLGGEASIECRANLPKATTVGPVEMRVLTLLDGSLRRSVIRGCCAYGEASGATLSITRGSPIADVLADALTSDRAFWAVGLDDFAFELPAPLKEET